MACRVRLRRVDTARMIGKLRFWGYWGLECPSLPAVREMRASRKGFVRRSYQAETTAEGRGLTVGQKLYKAPTGSTPQLPAQIGDRESSFRIVAGRLKGWCRA